jgi:hypothetical protein
MEIEILTFPVESQVKGAKGGDVRIEAEGGKGA